MKKSYYLLLLMLTMLSAAAKSQTNWVTKELDGKLLVKFPAEPQKGIKNGLDTYVYKGKDSVTYSTSVMDLKVIANFDSAALAPIKDTQKFADQIRMGIVSQRANYTFEDIAIGNWKTYTTYSVSGFENSNKNKVSLQMILIGSKMYAFSYLVPFGQVTKDNEIFFGSTELLKK